MDILVGLAKDGLGYTLFVLSVFVIIYQNRKLDQKEKEISDLHDKRLEDANLYTANFTTVAKEMVGANKDSANATALLQKSIDSITQILQNIMQNERK
jgi:dTDP-glucose pyrophosphorylase